MENKTKNPRYANVGFTIGVLTILLIIVTRGC